MTFPRVGVIGAGQLARMMAPAAEALGVHFHVLAESADGPATHVSSHVTVGDYTDYATLKQFASTVDVITFDHEHVPNEHLVRLIDEGINVHPGPHALQYAQNKLKMRAKIDELGLPNPRWAQIETVDDLGMFVREHGEAVLKTPTGGYDGHGVAFVRSEADLDTVSDWFGSGPLLAEQLIDFTRELAVMVGRSPSGQTAVWPVVATRQKDGICYEAVAPAPGLDAELSRTITQDVLTLAHALDVTGVMALEMFQTEDGYLVNELAMRPHNTGHWTQDGSVTSQFEQHLRAVLDLPLGDPAPLAPYTAMGNVLGADRDDLYHAYLHVLAHDPRAKVHMYGKSVRPGRKLGHVNVTGEDPEDVARRALHAAEFIAGVDDNPWPNRTEKA